MSKFFARFKGEKEDRSDLNPSSSSSSLSFASNNPYRNHISNPPKDLKHSYTPTPQHHEQPQTHEDPPPYHDWTVIPDTSLLPPPPTLTSDYSTTSNASYDDAAAAHAWCASHPVHRPQPPPPVVLAAVAEGKHALNKHKHWNLSAATPVFNGISTPCAAWRICHDKAKVQDLCWTTHLPLYLASSFNPLLTESLITLYYEIKPRMFNDGATIAMGFASLPYPTNRQPGWHRASLAVHSDDGNRYVNDSWGGRAFTAPFERNEILGLAVQILPEPAREDKALQSNRELKSDLPRCRTKIHFVRNGSVAGSWDMDEERDAEKDEGVAGLRGESDLYAAIGTYGHVDFEVSFYRDSEGFVPPPT